MDANVRGTCPEPKTKESVLSAPAYLKDEIRLLAEERGTQKVQPLHVLTLTPFYPSVGNPAQGCFVAEPLNFTEKLAIKNHVFAVQPFYRAANQSPGTDIHCEWKRHLCLPGNMGLSTAGEFVANSLMQSVAELHAIRKIDLIHAHAALPCGQASAMIGKQLRIPFVITVHGLDVFFAEQTGRLFSHWGRKASERVYEDAAAIICISEKVREKLAGKHAGKSVVIHNGVDHQMFSPAPVADSELRILSVGNLIPIKGHALLLRAFARICHAVPGCHIEIIGEGPERESLARLASSLRIASRVMFLGKRNRAEVAAAMQRCSLFALPSCYEGLGCVYLEAMSCGKPVIGCLQQGIEDVVKNGMNGLLIEPGDEQQLADLLLTVLQNEALRRRIGAAARNTIIQNHTMEHQAQALAALYRRCAA